MTTPEPRVSKLLAVARRHLEPSAEDARAQAPGYLLAALGCAAGFGLLMLPTAFGGPTVAPLDTRQHVYWMRRFEDPTLFPGDPHTDYLQGVAPLVYAAIYRVLAFAGMDPLVASKLLPILLAMATAFFCFRLAMRLFPVPAAAFAASLMLSQYAWMHPDLPTGTPRAFLYPGLLAFLDGLFGRHRGLLVGATAFTATTYPQYAVLELAVLAIWPWRMAWPPRLAVARSELVAIGAAAAAGGLALAWYALQTAPYGPVAAGAEALAMPEFQPHGFRNFFYEDPYAYWVRSGASGIAPYGYWLGFPPLMAAALLLPLVWRARARLGAASLVSADVWGLGKVLLGALALFGLAHATLFRLYYPARYVAHPPAVVAALAAAIVLAVAGATLVRRGARSARDGWLALGALGATAAVLVGTSFVLPDLPSRSTLRAGPMPALYAYLGTRPKDALVASLALVMRDVPMFARRKVLLATTTNPYHLGYYRPVREAAIALIAAQYAETAPEVGAFLRRYEVDVLVLERGAFEPAYLEANIWLRQFREEAAGIRARMRRGATFALQDPEPGWIVYEDEAVVVLQASSILAALAERPPVGGAP